MSWARRRALAVFPRSGRSDFVLRAQLLLLAWARWVGSPGPGLNTLQSAICCKARGRAEPSVQCNGTGEARALGRESGTGAGNDSERPSALGGDVGMSSFDKLNSN